MKNLLKLSAAAVAAMLCMTGANATVTIFGTSAARQCFEAAERESVTDPALRACDQAIEEEPLTSRERTATYVNRGIILFHRGAYDMAIADFDAAIALDPNEPEAFLNKGVALLRRDRSGAEASQLFTMALDMGTNEPALAYYARGLANELNGNLTGAYLDIQRANQLAPEWDVPARDLHRFIVRTGG